MFKPIIALLLSAMLFASTTVTLNTLNRNNSNTLAAQVTSSHVSDSSSLSSTLETLDITPKDSLSKGDIKDLLANEKYDYLEFGSSFKIGNDVLVDKVSKTAVDNLDNLDLDHFNNRQQMLSVMLDKQENQSFKISDITNAAKANIISGLPKFDSFKITRTKQPNPSQNNILINRIKSNSKVKDVKSAVIDQNPLSTQSQTNSSSQSQTQNTNSNSTSVKNNSSSTNLIQNLQSQTNQIGANLNNLPANLTKPITAQAAGISSAASSTSTNTDWIPSYTNISFFDTSETQLEPFKDYQSIEGATDKGIGTTYSNTSSKFYILKKDLNNEMSLTSIDQDGNKLTPWTKQSGSTQEGVTLATFNGKLFEGHVGSDKGQVWIRSSSDNGITWNNWSNPGNRQTGHAFAMTQFKNQLCIMHNGYGFGSNNYNGFNDNNTKIYIGCSSDGVAFPTWEQIAAGSYSSPSMVEANGYLYQSHRGMDKNQVWIRKCTGMNRGCDSWYWVKNGQSAEAIALTSVKSTPNTTTNDRICLMIKPVVDAIQTQPELQYTCTKNYDFNTFQPWKRSGDNTTNLAPSLSYAPGTGQLTASQLSQGNLAQFHVGLDGKVNYRVLPASSSTSVPSNLVKRGYYSEMRWSNPNNGFEENSTYEQDVKLYKYDDSKNVGGKIYLNPETGVMNPVNLYAPKGCHPSANGYWSSNLPNAYLDTRLATTRDNLSQLIFCDNASGEISYTIGSSYAKRIQANKTYFNYMILDKGMNTKDQPIAKVSAQKGEMRPDYCSFSNILPCSAAISITPNSRYSCNVKGDEYCSWIQNCKNDCQGKIMIPFRYFIENLIKFERGGDYPYWNAQCSESNPNPIYKCSTDKTNYHY